MVRRARWRFARELVDDLDGTVAGETISFALDGESYKIDLSMKNAERFRQAVRPYIDRAEIAYLDERLEHWSLRDETEGREGQLSDY